jgi:hypothetical protein
LCRHLSADPGDYHLLRLLTKYNYAILNRRVLLVSA